MTVRDVMNKLEGQFAEVLIYEAIENENGYPEVFDKDRCKIYKISLGGADLAVGFHSLMGEEEYNRTFNNGRKWKDFALSYNNHEAKVLCIMMAPKVTMYEYSIDNGSVVMYSHPAIISRTKNGCVYRFKSGKNSLNRTHVKEYELEQVKNNRIYALEGNLPKFRKKIIEKYREQTEELQTRVNERLAILEKLDS